MKVLLHICAKGVAKELQMATKVIGIQDNVAAFY